MKDWKKFAALVVVFLVAYFLPYDDPKVSNAVLEAFRLLQWYAIHHTLACVLPAMFIAGAISTFLSQASVMRYLGPRSNRLLAYGVASVAGVILAVCSCSVLPMFAGIYSLGAGLGPASAFLYSGPAINVLAIFLSARVLGLDLGVARALGAIVFAFIIGLLMHAVFRRGEKQRSDVLMQHPEAPPSRRPLWKTALYFACMVLLLVFSDWYNTNDVTIAMNDGTVLEANIRYSRQDSIDIQEYEPDGKLGSEIRRFSRSDIRSIEPKPGFAMTVHGIKWHLAGAMGLAVLLMLWRWFTREEVKEWLHATWDFGLMIVPLLFGGVFVTGFIGGLIPEKAVAGLVGGNSIGSDFVASFVGMIWYFATLTEIPIVEMLTRLGMGRGPALSLLLAGPALSLPSILVIYKVVGLRKTLVFCALTVVMSTVVGWLFGMFAS
ncbi:MAG: permease [Phycisphaerae bacterium]